MSRKGQPFVPGQRSQREQRISSHEFSAKDLKAASAETAVREYRGTAKLAPAWPGLVAAQLRGGRVIR